MYLHISAITLLSLLDVSVSTFLASVEHFHLRHVEQTHAHTFLQACGQILLTARTEDCRERVPERRNMTSVMIGKKTDSSILGYSTYAQINGPIREKKKSKIRDIYESWACKKIHTDCISPASLSCKLETAGSVCVRTNTSYYTWASLDSFRLNYPIKQDSNRLVCVHLQCLCTQITLLQPRNHIETNYSTQQHLINHQQDTKKHSDHQINHQRHAKKHSEHNSNHSQCPCSHITS